MKCTNYTIEWAALNFNTDFDFKTNKLYCYKGKHKKVGLNAFANRVYILNNRIPLSWFDMSIEMFKIHRKKEFLS